MPDDLTLAQRAAALPRWRWLTGMRAHGWIGVRSRRICGRFLVEHVDPHTGAPLNCDRRIRTKRRAEWSVIFDATPDLADPAALACLLSLAREAWGCDEYRRLTVEPAGAGWCCVLRNGRHRPPSRARAGWDLDRVAHSRYRDVPSLLGGEHPTEAEAIVSALEAAP